MTEIHGSTHKHTRISQEWGTEYSYFDRNIQLKRRKPLVLDNVLEDIREVSMFEFDMKAFVWLCIGAGGTMITLLMMSLCSVSGRCSRMEELKEAKEGRIRIENWENTPERRAMTERSR